MEPIISEFTSPSPNGLCGKYKPTDIYQGHLSAAQEDSRGSEDTVPPSHGACSGAEDSAHSNPVESHVRVCC